MEFEQLTGLFQHFGVEKGMLIWALLLLWRENKRAHQALLAEKERFMKEWIAQLQNLRAEIRTQREQAPGRCYRRPFPHDPQQ